MPFGFYPYSNPPIGGLPREVVPRLGRALDAGGVLVPDLVARGVQAGGVEAVDDVDGPGVVDGADVLARDADGQVVAAVAIEVPHRQAQEGPSLQPLEGRPMRPGASPAWVPGTGSTASEAKSHGR